MISLTSQVPAIAAPMITKRLMHPSPTGVIPRLEGRSDDSGSTFTGREFYNFRKFSSSLLPSCVRIDSGWNWTPWTGMLLVHAGP